jgi:hypothetical protein
MPLGNSKLVEDLGGLEVGREGGLYSLRFFTEPKNLCMREG